MSALVTITEDLLFPEGPIAMPDGSIILVEIARGTLTRVLPDGRKEIIAETGGGPNGAAIGPDGACYVCNNGGFEWEKDQKTNCPPTPITASKTSSIINYKNKSDSLTPKTQLGPISDDDG